MKGPLETLGMVPLGDKSVDQFNEFVKAETARWAKVIRDAGIKQIE